MNGPERPCKRNFFILSFTKFPSMQSTEGPTKATEASSAPRCPVLRTLSFIAAMRKS